MIPRFADQPALAEAEARFRGEAVALVAFEDGADAAPRRLPGRLDAAARRSADPAAAEAAGAAALHPDRPGNRLIEGRVRRGDAAAALAASAHVADGRLGTGFVEHAYIEPEAGAAWLDGDTLVIRACTQAPYMDRDDTAAMLGLPPRARPHRPLGRRRRLRRQARPLGAAAPRPRRARRPAGRCA